MFKRYYPYYAAAFVAALMMIVMSVDIRSAVANPSAQATTQTIRELADKNNFHFGAAVYTTHLDHPEHVETLSREFNMLTPENEAKFCEIQPKRGQFYFGKLDRLVDFATQHDMVVHGHTLVWHQCMPNWLATAKFDREEAIKVLRQHIYTLVGRYKGIIPIWDVVNEAIADDNSGLRDTPWKQMIGDDYIEMAFRFAHEADPDALLFYNDYSAEGINAKSDTIYDMVKDFVDRGVPINGVGLQSHFTVGSINTESIAKNIARLGELGLQVQITEMDDRYPGDGTDKIYQKQAGDYRRVLETCLDYSNCTAFITWGVSDKYTWLRDANLGFFENPKVNPLLFDDKYQPKPAYYAVLDILSRRAGEAPVLTDEEVKAMRGARPVTSGG